MGAARRAEKISALPTGSKHGSASRKACAVSVSHLPCRDKQPGHELVAACLQPSLLLVFYIYIFAEE